MSQQEDMKSAEGVKKRRSGFGGSGCLV